MVLRKDTRRFRYRTTVVVGGVLRYFDVMQLQRYRGVLVYVNNVQRGQPEVYVVLEKSQIGIRIRESFAIDIDRPQDYRESFGMLDVTVSVPTFYGIVGASFGCCRSDSIKFIKFSTQRYHGR